MNEDFKFEEARYEISNEEIRRIQRLAKMLIHEEMSKNGRILVGESLLNIVGNAVGK